MRIKTMNKKNHKLLVKVTHCSSFQIKEYRFFKLLASLLFVFLKFASLDNRVRNVLNTTINEAQCGCTNGYEFG